MRAPVQRCIRRNTRLRIPMRGYESKLFYLHWPREDGYESPCGVMRRHHRQSRDIWRKLRIPMRGYEYSRRFADVRDAVVTNPHAGL